MSTVEEQIRDLVEGFTVETDYDYGFGGDLVEVQRVDRQEAYGLIEDFVRPLLERAEKAEAALARVEEVADDLIRVGGTVNGQFIRARLRNAP